MLVRVQNDLFVVGSALADPNPEGRVPFRNSQTTTLLAAGLERTIDVLEADLLPLTQFILPGGRPPPPGSTWRGPSAHRSRRAAGCATGPGSRTKHVPPSALGLPQPAQRPALRLGAVVSIARPARGTCRGAGALEPLEERSCLITGGRQGGGATWPRLLARREARTSPSRTTRAARGPSLPPRTIARLGRREMFGHPRRLSQRERPRPREAVAPVVDGWAEIDDMRQHGKPVPPHSVLRPLTPEDFDAMIAANLAPPT